jgi:transposase
VPVPALVEADLLEEVPPDLDELRSLLPQADLYLQDEVQFAFHPTLTRVWGWKGRRGQRLVEAPGANDKVYGFGLVDWCEGWFDGRLAPGRTADIFCAQIRAAVARSRARGRMALVIVDNLRTHTSAGSKLVRRMLAELQAHLRLIYTPAYDPDANRIEWLWRWSRREVTHNHQRTTFAALRRISRRTLRLCGSIPTWCYGRLGVRLRSRSQQPNHWPMPHDLFGSI